ncbi:MAG: nitroreductase family protein [Lachnospiraceae bacterium]
MDFYDVIKSRKTTREFADKSVEMEKIKKVLSAGLMAPTHDHLRNWEFVVITDSNMIEQVLSGVPKMNGTKSTGNPPQARSIQHLMYDYSMPIQCEMLKDTGCIIFPFFKQAGSLYKSETVSGLNAFASIWCCVENIFLAATAEGLACSMRIPTGNEPEHVYKVLRHPQNYMFPCYIGLGYPAPDTTMPEQVKCNIEDKLHFDKW